MHHNSIAAYAACSGLPRVRGVFKKGHDRSRFSTGMRKVLKHLRPFVLDLEMNKWIATALSVTPVCRDDRLNP
jgi:hypothetical protein